MLKINDIFWSLQGEGLRAGAPAVFIRLSGCLLRCPYCDTPNAWSAGRRMSVAKIEAAVEELKRSFPESRLVITGGEPLQQDLRELLARCHQKKYFVAVETNGLHFQDLPFDWWTVSPKDVADYRVHPRLWARAAEIKLLVTPALDLEVLESIRRQTPAAIILQPEHGRPGKYRHAFELFHAGQRRGIANLRLGAQLHKIYRVP
ncbi:MAG: 7-carboxy-7-deazaguanine synthase QueE [Candidatus Aminicenantes bacterium]|nr:7-carboxy-7-deazaguanine synthase QueE [Candidatus Aminicenantes bacterium]